MRIYYNKQINKVKLYLLLITNKMIPAPVDSPRSSTRILKNHLQFTIFSTSTTVHAIGYIWL